MGSSRTQNPKNSHNNQSQHIGISKQSKTTRSTGNAKQIEKNQILAGMGHKHTSHVVPKDENSEES